jgi:hypothetical protein
MYQLTWTPEVGEPEVLSTANTCPPTWQITCDIVQRICPDASVPILTGYQKHLNIEYYYVEHVVAPNFLEGTARSTTRVSHVDKAGWLLAGKVSPVGVAVLSYLEEEVLPEIDLSLDTAGRAPLVAPAVTIEEELRATIAGMQTQMEQLSRAIDLISMRQMNESALSTQCDLFLRVEELEKESAARRYKKEMRREQKKTEDADERLANEIKNFDLGTLRHVVDRY